jgi:hypothetical protein
MAATQNIPARRLVRLRIATALGSTTMKMQTKKMGNEFTVGVAWAIATTYRQHDNGVACADLVRAAGLTLRECERAGVDDYDMKILRKLFKTERLGSQSDAKVNAPLD